MSFYVTCDCCDALLTETEQAKGERFGRTLCDPCADETEQAQRAAEPTYAEKLHSGARLHMAHGADIETAKRMAALAIRAGEEDH